jgi:hypothetical protein
MFLKTLIIINLNINLLYISGEGSEMRFSSDPENFSNPK